MNSNATIYLVSLLQVYSTTFPVRNQIILMVDNLGMKELPWNCEFGWN